jgi:DNA-binding NarL/FixJ family response regulator
MTKRNSGDRPQLRWTEAAELGFAVLSFDRGDAPGGIGQLSGAQEAVASLAVRGLTNREIAAELRISIRTVANHMAEILRRTGAASRFELAHKMPAPVHRDGTR